MEEVRIPLLSRHSSDCNGVSSDPIAGDGGSFATNGRTSCYGGTEHVVSLEAESQNGHADYRLEIQEQDHRSSLEGRAVPAYQNSSSDTFSDQGPGLPIGTQRFSYPPIANDHLQNVISCLGEQPCIGPQPSVDPFRNSTPNIVGLYAWTKIILCAPLLVARVLLVVVLMCIGFVSTKLALARWKQKKSAMPKWRCNVMGVTRLCARGILFCFGFHWIRRIGRPAHREIAPIFVSNHVSYVDPIFYFYELFPSFVSSSSHNDIFLVGTIIKAMQVILVDRLSPDSRKDAANEIKRRASCNDFPPVLLFPEGTTTNGRAVISFKLGAFVPGFPIQPVVVRYPHVHHDPSWGNISLWKLVPRMLTQFHNFMEVEYLPIIYPSEAESQHPIEFAEKVRYEMATVLNVPETEHTYGDLMLLTKASELKLIPATSSMVEMGRVGKIFHLTTSEVKDYLNHFVAMGPNKRGFVTKGKFLETIDLPDCEFSNNIFLVFDKLKRGYFNFREFVGVLGFISKNTAFDGLVTSAFEACDTDRDGCLSRSEVEQSLRTIFPQVSG
ncbi:hypothetical protein O6H91_20G062400 [Diphasiastrum complanatum]|nr:hypothetical protein O6H91_20G062400 [Diphasiastrum complanatum]